MIGIKLRGVRHLWRMVDTSSLNYILVKTREREYDICEVIKLPSDHPYGEKMFILNYIYNHNNDVYISLVDRNEEFAKMVKGIEHNKVITVSKGNKYDNLAHFNQFFQEIILLPKTFHRDYESFLKENNKMVKALVNKYGQRTMSHITPKLFYIYGNGSKNLYQWAADLYYKHSVRLSTLKTIFQWNDDYNQLMKNLSKGTITAYTNSDSIITLLEELQVLRNNKRVNDAINSFNTAQKKLLKSNSLTDADNKTLARFAKLSDTKRINFIKKVSTIDDFSELMRQMRHVTSTHFNWNKDSFMDFVNNVEGINYEIIVDSGDVVLTKVNDYETIKQFGKTTNWCISKNKSYWNNYIEYHGGKTTQYMLFDFSKMEDDKLSIIGLTTTRNKGITSAHDFTNNNLMGSPSRNTQFIKSFLARFQHKNDIYSLISDCGIDIASIVEFDKPQYKWDKEGLMEYLFECVNSENVDILKSAIDNENKMVLSICDENIRYFLGDAYIDNIPSEFWGLQHIVFIDFSKSQFDPNRLQFAIIYNGNLGDDYCESIYNELSNTVDYVDFDMKLIEFGMPYDIIRRADNKTRMLTRAFTNRNYKLLNEYISKDKHMIADLFNILDHNVVFDAIWKTISEDNSFDYLNMIYDNGYKLHGLINTDYLAELFDKVFKYHYQRIPNVLTDGMLIPSDEMIEKFNNESLNTFEEVSYVGSYLQFKMLFDNEIDDSINYNSLYFRLLSRIHRTPARGELVDKIILDLSDRLNFEKKNSESLKLFFNVGVMSSNNDVQYRVTEMAKTSEHTAKLYANALAYKMKLNGEITVAHHVQAEHI